jgi:uncharacterized membrane protein YgaE (UPF0421/DUF939 family)
MQPRHFEAILFSVKAAVAAVAGVFCYKLFDLPGAPWVAAVSAVLVTQPNLHSSLQTSLMRVIANLIGAFGGAVLLVIIGQPIVAMATGVMVTGLLCYLLKQDDALRPAFVAVIIVTLTGETAGWAQPAEPRRRRRHRLRAGRGILVRQIVRCFQSFAQER